MHLQKTKQAFTLTELVVTITILAILSTIGFVSYSSNISDTRDSKRELDIKTIQIGLRDHKNKKGTYPLPGDFFNIVYSAQNVAHQGFFNTKVITSSLEVIPSDPLDKSNYSYSVTADRKQYQVATTLENQDREITLLKGDYQSVAKNILPNIILATQEPIGANIEIGEGIGNGDNNRKLFLFNNMSENIIYSFESQGAPVSKGEDFSTLLQKSEDIDFWQKHTYKSCDEILNAGKNIGSGEYQIMNNEGGLDNVTC